MVILQIVAVALLLSLSTGGSLTGLKNASLRGEGLLVPLLCVQVLWPRIVKLADASCTASLVTWLAMMGSLVVLLLINTRRFPALALAAIGIAANMLVISVNGAMPVSIRAASEIGGGRQLARSALENDCLHAEMDERTSLRYLADTIAIPGPIWQRAVISPGDILLGLGLGGWLFTVTRKHRSHT